MSRVAKALGAGQGEIMGGQALPMLAQRARVLFGEHAAQSS
jgi:hypothetical protein